MFPDGPLGSTIIFGLRHCLISCKSAFLGVEAYLSSDPWRRLHTGRSHCKYACFCWLGQLFTETKKSGAPTRIPYHSTRSGMALLHTTPTRYLNSGHAEDDILLNLRSIIATGFPGCLGKLERGASRNRGRLWPNHCRGSCDVFHD